MKYDIICLLETWKYSGDFNIPTFLHNYSYVYLLASKKDGSRGRASGGIIIFVRNKKYLNYNLIESNDAHIIIDISITNSDKYRLVVFYWRPQYEHNDFYLESMKNILHYLKLLDNDNVNVFCIGDFNAHIGLNDNEYDDYLFEGTCISSIRQTTDTLTTVRGVRLLDLMENNGYLVVNGRTKSDALGAPTYLSKDCQSVIDLAWADAFTIQNILDFSVENFSMYSDHQLCSLKIKCVYLSTLKNDSKNIHIVNKIKWKKENSQTYINSISQQYSIYYNDVNIDNLSDNLLTTLKSSLWESGMLIETSNNINRTYKSPWYNKNCIDARKQIDAHYKILKQNNFDKEHLANFTMFKKKYKAVINQTKSNYEKSLLNKMRNVKNCYEFWKTIQKFRKSDITYRNEISIDTWQNYFINIYSPSPPIHIILLNQVHPILDNPITLNELIASLTSLKNNKSTGIDSLPNECFKSLTSPWIHYLLNLFNLILLEEYVPPNWSETLIKLIYKKNDAMNPDNYRPIALQNTCLKIYVTILKNRLCKYAENRGLLPEEQSGFRLKRACIDNIYILNSLIDLQVKIENEPFFGILIDYRKAFDSVPHDKMFQKLDHLGIYGKYIRTIAKIYINATVKIDVNGTNTDSINVTKGVLQGDPLSAELYILYTSDMGNFFRSRGFRGIRIGPNDDVLMTTFADDTVFFAYSVISCQDILNSLLDYCNLNDLTVNASKTSILTFFKGRPCELRTVYYQGHPIDYVREAKYLGVTFSCSGKFLKHKKNTITKAHMASGKVLSTLSACKSDTWLTKMTLFNSLVKSILLYASEIWAPDYFDDVEVVQSKFLKSLLHLPINTPHYMIRYEFERLPLKYNIDKAIIEWWIKLLSMNNDRLPRRCYNAIYNHVENDGLQYTWVYSVKKLLFDLNKYDLWYTQDPQTLKHNKRRLLNKLSDSYKQEDLHRIEFSSYTTLYKNILTLEKSHTYFQYLAPIHKTRAVAQLRLSADNIVKLYIKKNKCTFDVNSNCSICNLHEPDSLEHALLNCPMYLAPRNKYLHNFFTDNMSLASLLSNVTPLKLCYLFYFVDEMIRIRQMIM